MDELMPNIPDTGYGYDTGYMEQAKGFFTPKVTFIALGALALLGLGWYIIQVKIGKGLKVGNDSGFNDVNNGSRESGGGAWQAATVLTPVLEKMVDDIYGISRYKTGWVFDCGDSESREKTMWGFVGLSGQLVEQRAVNQRFVEKYGGGGIQKAIAGSGCKYPKPLQEKLDIIYTSLG